MYTTIFYSHRRLLGILAALALGFALVACGGGKQKKKDQPAVETVSLSRTFTLVDGEWQQGGHAHSRRYGRRRNTKCRLVSR